MSQPSRLRRLACILALAASFGGGCRPAAVRGPAEAPSGTVPPPRAERLSPEGPAAPLVAGLGEARGSQGAVSSAEANASEIGVEVLRRGGNAVDAAVAVGFALGVTHPSAGNIGGGGFMVVRFPDGRSSAIDYRETAPGKAQRDMYVDASGAVTADSRLGPLAAGIPGVVAGLWLAHQRYGSLQWAELLAPAVRLARDGWQLDRYHADDLEWGSRRVETYLQEVRARPAKQPSQQALVGALEATFATFSKPGGAVYTAGDVWRQPELAATLQAIATHGPEAFYRGRFAAEMAQRVAQMGGLWTPEDLAGYRAIERQPIAFTYRGHEIVTMPPPSAGGVVLRQILAAADALSLHSLNWDSSLRQHLYVEALRRTYADRNELLGDPDFIEIPLQELLDTAYIGKRMAGIDRGRATPSSVVGAGVERRESEQTTHFSVVDREGVAVSNTYTLNGGFGAKLQVPGTGVTLNNEMDDFTAKVGAPNMFGLVQGPQNSIAPGKRMLSSMSPTIVSRDGSLRAVVGSPGGPTITTTVAQIVMQLIDHGRSLKEAVAAPRIHHQWLPDKLWHEARLPQAQRDALKGLGHSLGVRPRIGHANCIEVDPSTRQFVAIADVDRDGGGAVAY